MTTRVIIIRHGQSTYNAQKMIQGRCDESVLTEKGQGDALKVGRALQGIPLDGFYCSPLRRAQETAEIITQSLDPVPVLTSHPLLMEIDLPQWEKMRKADVQAQYPEAYGLWRQHPEQFKMVLETGQEHYPVLALYEQARQFWQEILAKHQGQTVAIAAHNGINRCLIMSAAGIPPAYYQSLQQSNCAINVLNFQGGLGDPVQLESLNQTAHLGVDLPGFRPGHRGPRFLLIRHGETNWNRESRFQGIKDIPLNDTGRGQARKAASFLQDQPLDFAITSPMARPKETAELITAPHPNLTLETDDRLMEISHGLWEGKLEAEIKMDFPGLLQQWKDQPETVQMPEGENLQQVWDRAIAAWEDFVVRFSDRDDNPVGIVVAHDAINKVILCHVLGLQPADIWKIKQGNCAVTAIDYPQGKDGKAVVQALNITSHFSQSIIDQTAAGAL